MKVAHMARRQSLLLNNFELKPANVNVSGRSEDELACKTAQRANCNVIQAYVYEICRYICQTFRQIQGKHIPAFHALSKTGIYA